VIPDGDARLTGKTARLNKPVSVPSPLEIHRYFATFIGAIVTRPLSSDVTIGRAWAMSFTQTPRQDPALSVSVSPDMPLYSPFDQARQISTYI
jgi:hypothetical protein